MLNIVVGDIILSRGDVVLQGAALFDSSVVLGSQKIVPGAILSIQPLNQHGEVFLNKHSVIQTDSGVQLTQRIITCSTQETETQTDDNPDWTFKLSPFLRPSMPGCELPSFDLSNLDNFTVVQLEDVRDPKRKNFVLVESKDRLTSSEKPQLNESLLVEQLLSRALQSSATSSFVQRAQSDSRETKPEVSFSSYENLAQIDQHASGTQILHKEVSSANSTVVYDVPSVLKSAETLNNEHRLKTETHVDNSQDDETKINTEKFTDYNYRVPQLCFERNTNASNESRVSEDLNNIGFFAHQRTLEAIASRRLTVHTEVPSLTAAMLDNNSFEQELNNVNTSANLTGISVAKSLEDSGAYSAENMNSIQTIEQICKKESTESDQLLLQSLTNLNLSNCSHRFDNDANSTNFIVGSYMNDELNINNNSVVNSYNSECPARNNSVKYKSSCVLDNANKLDNSKVSFEAETAVLKMKLSEIQTSSPLTANQTCLPLVNKQTYFPLSNETSSNEQANETNIYTIPNMDKSIINPLLYNAFENCSTETKQAIIAGNQEVVESAIKPSEHFDDQPAGQNLLGFDNYQTFLAASVIVNSDKLVAKENDSLLDSCYNVSVKYEGDNNSLTSKLRSTELKEPFSQNLIYSNDPCSEQSAKLKHITADNEFSVSSNIVQCNSLSVEGTINYCSSENRDCIELNSDDCLLNNKCFNSVTPLTLDSSSCKVSCGDKLIISYDGLASTADKQTSETVVTKYEPNADSLCPSTGQTCEKILDLDMLKIPMHNDQNEEKLMNTSTELVVNVSKYSPAGIEIINNKIAVSSENLVCNESVSRNILFIDSVPPKDQLVSLKKSVSLKKQVNESVPNKDQVNESVSNYNQLNKSVPFRDQVNESVSNQGNKSVSNKNQVSESTPSQVNKSVPNKGQVNESFPKKDQVNELVPNKDQINELAPHKDQANESVPIKDQVNELVPNKDCEVKSMSYKDPANEIVARKVQVNESVHHKDQVNKPISNKDPGNELVLKKQLNDPFPHKDQDNESVLYLKSVNRKDYSNESVSNEELFQGKQSNIPTNKTIIESDIPADKTTIESSSIDCLPTLDKHLEKISDDIVKANKLDFGVATSKYINEISADLRDGKVNEISINKLESNVAGHKCHGKIAEYSLNSQNIQSHFHSESTQSVKNQTHKLASHDSNKQESEFFDIQHMAINMEKLARKNKLADFSPSGYTASDNSSIPRVKPVLENVAKYNEINIQVPFMESLSACNSPQLSKRFSSNQLSISKHEQTSTRHFENVENIDENIRDSASIKHRAQLTSLPTLLPVTSGFTSNYHQRMSSVSKSPGEGQLSVPHCRVGLYGALEDDRESEISDDLSINSSDPFVFEFSDDSMSCDMDALISGLIDWDRHEHWMSQLPKALHNIPLCRLFIPGKKTAVKGVICTM